ncbi:hypothetical protein ABK040_013606 [Willaertia magna]
MEFENLNLNQIPISVNNTISNLIELSLAKNNISSIDNLNKNLQRNLFVDFSDNKIKGVSILNFFKYINLDNNPILQNNNIGIYNSEYITIDTEDITFKKYFQSNFMELYLFNNMEFVKTLKKKNGNNCKAKVLSNSQAIFRRCNYIKEEINVWDKSSVDLEKINYIEKNWKVLTLKK